MKRDLPWRKSRDCTDHSCLEVAITEDGVLVRNSAVPDEVVRFTHTEWQLFLNGVRRGEFQQ